LNYYSAWGVRFSCNTPLEGLYCTQTENNPQLSIHSSTTKNLPKSDALIFESYECVHIHIKDIAKITIQTQSIIAEFGHNHPPSPFLTGRAIALWLELHEHTMLHGNSLHLNNKNIALLGPSGSGKSTLTAQLIIGGAHLINDDLIAISEKNPDKIHAGSTALRLWPDSLPQQWLPQDKWPKVHPLETKLRVSLKQYVLPTKKSTLHAIIILDRKEGEHPIELNLLSPANALLETYAQGYQPATINQLKREKRRLQIISTLLSTVPVYMLSYPDGKQHFKQITDLIQGIS